MALRLEMIISIPPNFQVRNLADIRQLEISIRIPHEDLDIEESFSAFRLLLGRAALSAANDFVSDTLSLYIIKGR